MSGVAIISELLRADEALIDRVPADRIKAGALPENAELDAIVMRSISRTEHQPLKIRPKGRVFERVAVTVRAESYRSQTQLMDLIRDACRGRTGAIAGCARVSVLTAGTGPDLRGPGASFEQTQDFRVSFE